MLDGITTDQLIGYGSGWAIVGAFVLAILTGRLIPRHTHERELAEKAQQVERANHDAAEWRTEGRLRDQQVQIMADIIREKDVQLGHMAEVGRTIKDVLAAIRALALGHPPEEPT